MDAYVSKKIAHLKRQGLVGPKSTGTGKHGGACPDWLVAEQKESAKNADSRQWRELERSRSSIQRAA